MTRLLGWCLDGLHDRPGATGAVCRGSYVRSDLLPEVVVVVCACDCHQDRYGTPSPNLEVCD